MKKAIIISGILVILYILYRWWVKVPVAVVNVNADGSGVVELGGNSSNFSSGMGASVSTITGYSLSSDGNTYSLTHYGAVITSGGIPAGNMQGSYVSTTKMQ